ncbi:unnamed protein product [Cuscuta epithymum]|uniref:Uncharacterized protein n=1 Tax=Cuscuta epithymum TaxID=186058 RepID=A0AAV0FTF3_9ASTE|nr:unnamed protein product [Cuscuta epithymum]
MPDPGPARPPGPKEHHHRTRPERSNRAHRVLHPVLQNHGRPGSDRRRKFHQHVPRPAMEALFPNSCDGIVPEQCDYAPGMAGMERELRAGYSVLRGVLELRTRGRVGKPGQLDGLPRNHGL